MLTAVELNQVPVWQNPLLVGAFRGWGDAAGVATTAAAFLLQGREIDQIAELDPEAHFVLTETRPHVRQREGGGRRIEWPSLTLLSARGRGRDVAALIGPEPQLRWRSFARELAELWRRHGQDGPAVLLGAFLAGVSHSAPVVLTGFATTDSLREQLVAAGVQPSNYEGPTGVHSALAEAFEAKGIPCVSVWAAVPHYLAAMPNPKACAAVLRALDQLLDLKLDLREMDDAARSFERQVSLAMARGGQTVALTQADESARQPVDEESRPAGPLPSADELVRGVEEFLKKNRPA